MTAPTARQNKLPQPEPPSLADPMQAEYAAVLADLEDLRAENERLLQALAGSTLPEAPASVNFYAVTAKGWNLQYTLRAWTDAELVPRFVALLKSLEELKIQPKPVGQQPASPTAEAAPATNGSSPAPSGPYEWKMKNGALDMFKGKMTLILHGSAAEPNEIPCPQHPGKMLKRRANDDGAWLSHKQGEGFCSASFYSE